MPARRLLPHAATGVRRQPPESGACRELGHADPRGFKAAHDHGDLGRILRLQVPRVSGPT
jgi:hypothetical protein